MNKRLSLKILVGVGLLSAWIIYLFDIVEFGCFAQTLLYVISFVAAFVIFKTRNKPPGSYPTEKERNDAEMAGSFSE